ncbi:unnamed protein product, partial [marine sediment metagenome]
MQKKLQVCYPNLRKIVGADDFVDQTQFGKSAFGGQISKSIALPTPI